MIDHIRAHRDICAEVERIGAELDALVKKAEPLERFAIPRHRLEGMVEAAEVFVRDTGRLMQVLEGEGP